VSILVPVYKVAVKVLRETVASVAAQTYDQWELCITVCADDTEALDYLKSAAAADPRIKLKVLAENQGISGNSNEALTLATGPFLALLDHDDTLAPFALFEVVRLLNQDTEANFIYSDKDLLSAGKGERIRPLFKPQWSPEMMWNANYLTHLCVMRTAQVRQIGGWRKETDGAQDWDLFLRIIQTFGGVRHIPKVLYHWRMVPTSVASRGLEAKPWAADGQVRAVADYCTSSGVEATVERTATGDLRLRWPQLAGESISVLCLPPVAGESSTNDGAARDWLAAMLAKTTHASVEFLMPDASGSPLAMNRVRYVAVKRDLDATALLQKLAREAKGDVLAVVDGAVTPEHDDWLTELVGPLRINEIGLVGPRLLDASTRSVRHCGLVINRLGQAEHLYAAHPEQVFEQFGSAGWYRNCSAVSGACFAVRRSDWPGLDGGGKTLLHPRFDVHVGLKVRERGLRVLYNPYARLLQSGQGQLEVPRGEDGQASMALMRTVLPGGDPFFNANLDCHQGRLSYRRKPKPQAHRHDYSAESVTLAKDFDCSAAQIARSIEDQRRAPGGPLKTLLWFLPEFGHAFYGGVHTILRFADHLQRVHGVRSHFCIMGRAPADRVRQQIGSAFPALAASPVFVHNGLGAIDTLPAVDASICTLWTTAYAQLLFTGARRKFYFMQDDEALFYPAGSTSALVEATYGFGFNAICNTVSLLKRYEGGGGKGEYFVPAIDNAVFHSRGRKPHVAAEPYHLFCYMRPGHARNGFELMATAMRKLKKRMGAAVNIIAAGEQWEPSAYGLEGVVNNLGLLDYGMTGALYRACDAGLVLMMTRHPSYLPLELMSCGALVVTNRNTDTGWLLKDGGNCLLTEPVATAIADRVETGLRDTELRRRVTEKATATLPQHVQGWEASIEKIHRYMREVCS
jgi:O-antigen biosynthesis protein